MRIRVGFVLVFREPGVSDLFGRETPCYFL